MSKLRVGVVRGGPSSEYAVSLKTGENVLRNLDPEKYEPYDILLTTRGEWYLRGVRTDFERLSGEVDVIWNALHGTYGEDGKVQRVFESFGIPYTGSDSLASALGMNKILAKERFVADGLRVPKGIVVEAEQNMNDVIFRVVQTMRLPLVVKPVSGGSSVATKVVRTWNDLETAILSAVKYGDVLIEEKIEGKEATVCVIDSGEEGKHLVMYPIEIVPPEENEIFDYDAKYSGVSQEICPGRFPLTTHGELRELAIRAHNAIGARHYSRSDFIVSPKGIYILEINTLPGLTSESLVPKALKAGGVGISDFIDHVIGLSLAERA